jgi:hypothetical protein
MRSKISGYTVQPHCTVQPQPGYQTTPFKGWGWSFSRDDGDGNLNILKDVMLLLLKPREDVMLFRLLIVKITENFSMSLLSVKLKIKNAIPRDLFSPDLPQQIVDYQLTIRGQKTKSRHHLHLSFL